MKKRKSNQIDLSLRASSVRFSFVRILHESTIYYYYDNEQHEEKVYFYGCIVCSLWQVGDQQKEPQNTVWDAVADDCKRNEKRKKNV